MKKRTIRFLIVFITIFQLFFIATILPNFASGSTRARDSPYPNITIAFIEPSKTANVSLGDTGVVVFNGILSVKFPEGYQNPVAYIKISLLVEDTWGNSTVTPVDFLFTENGDSSFDVTVIVPLRTDFRDTGVVTVTGFWVMEPTGFYDSVQPSYGIQGRINIGQYYNFSLSSPKTVKKAELWDNIIYELIVENKGNFPNVFLLKVLILMNYQRIA